MKGKFPLFPSWARTNRCQSLALHYGDAAHELEHRILARGLIRPPRDASLGRVAATKQVVHIADIRTIPSYVERNPFVVTPAQSVLIDVGNILTGGGSSHQQTQNAPDQTQADAGGASDQTRRLVSAVLGSTEVVWGKMFQASGEQYEPPILVMFSGVTRSGCGFAQSAMGPFYCPLDHKVYLDTSFFQDLERRFRG
jgi:predicted metalloprotease